MPMMPFCIGPSRELLGSCRLYEQVDQRAVVEMPVLTVSSLPG